MGLYARHVLPRLVDRLCAADALGELRAAIVPLAEGVVLEVGSGTGLNLPWYDPARVARVLALEPSEEMRARARERNAAVPFPVEPLACGAEEVPLPTASVDSVVITFTLCTVPEPLAALEGLRRVLRPGGRLLFCEHGLAPEERVARWQRRLNPLWRRAFGGCHLDRDVTALLERAGFAHERLERGYLEGGPRLASYTYRGVARPR